MRTRVACPQERNVIMNPETFALPSQTPASSAGGGPTIPAVPGAKPIPEKWKSLFRELTTYYRHLPTLLAEGEAGRYVDTTAPPHWPAHHFTKPLPQECR